MPSEVSPVTASVELSVAAPLAVTVPIESEPKKPTVEDAYAEEMLVVDALINVWVAVNEFDV